MSKSVIVEGISKKFKLHHEKERNSKRRSPFPRLLGQSQRETEHAPDEDFWALRDISFEVDQGERLAIVGRNGAGKSTLLKILSRVMSPTEGRIQIRGRLSSLLEVGTGFHPDLTGRENIYLNGAVLGMPRAEVRRKFDAIVDFAEVERFLDTPVKHYSSGMYVRLAFAVSAFLEPDVVILDEVLSVGDTRFQRKSYEKIRQLAGDGRSVIFVSHSPGAVRALCSKALFLENGRVISYGSVDEIIEEYESEPIAAEKPGRIYLADWKNRSGGDFGAKIQWAEVESSDLNEQIPTFHIGGAIRIRFCIELDTHRQGGYLKLAVQVKTRDGIPIANMIGEDSGFCLDSARSREIVSIFLEDIRFYPGKYLLSFWAGSVDSDTWDCVHDCVSLEISNGGSLTTRSLPRDGGLFFITPDWNIEDE